MMRLLLLAACLTPASALGAEIAAGKPIGSDVLTVRDNVLPSADLNMTLNSEKDRVGATYTACGLPGYKELDDCDVVEFVFPDLRYDRQTGRVTRGEEVVAVDRGLRGIELEKGYRLEPRVIRETVDDGFTRSEVRRVRALLLKAE